MFNKRKDFFSTRFSANKQKISIQSINIYLRFGFRLDHLSKQKIRTISAIILRGGDGEVSQLKIASIRMSRQAMLWHWWVKWRADERTKNNNNKKILMERIWIED